ncbi:MAG: hypothetical protein GXO64_03065 [Candidatus Micrarchaeota archaeon]|nr:hypothetical protein [Candidatus Micrarchaeota archaeon]
MFGIGDKKKNAPKGGSPPARMRVPVEEVMALSARGFSEPEIVNALKKKGHSLPEIDEAMKEALRNTATGLQQQPPAMNSGRFPNDAHGGSFDSPPAGPAPAFEQPRNYGPPSDFGTGIGEAVRPHEPPGFEDLGPPSRQLGEMGPPPGDMPTGNQFGPPQRPQAFGQPQERSLPPLEQPRPQPKERKVNKKQIEELVEVIIEEKWHEMRTKLKEIDNKFLEMSNKIISLENSIRQMQADRGSELKQIENMIDSYKNSLNEMNSKIQSMENAMKDSMTPLITTLRSLSETINEFKEKKGM